MEADIYELISNALNEQSCHVSVPLQNSCGIDRIVWSVWSYIMGPELKFVWEFVSSEADLLPHTSEDNHSEEQMDNNIKTDENQEKSSDGDVGNYREPSVDDVQANPGQKPKEDDSACETSAAEESMQSADKFSSACCLDIANIRLDKQVPDSAEHHQDVPFFDMDDDRYVAMHTLSSEIYSTHIIESVELKILRLAERKMGVASYIFAARYHDQRAVHSIALVMNENRLGWFFKIQPLFQLFFNDFVVKLKASILMESREELLTRMTSEFVQILKVVSELERYSLEAVPFNISDTHFAEVKVQENKFLYRCITTHLRCQGYTIVVGKSTKSINKMIKTLAFVTYRDRWCMSKVLPTNVDEANETEFISSRQFYSPYLVLQGCCKLNLSTILSQAYYCNWPFCVIDVDAQTVCSSLPWEKHQEIRQQVRRRDLQKIFLPDSPISSVKINFKEHDAGDNLVSPFLKQLDYLPYESAVREGFTLQFLRSLALRALALDIYAESESNAGKERSNICIKTLRKALDLTVTGDYLTVLAIADQMRPTAIAKASVTSRSLGRARSSPQPDYYYVIARRRRAGVDRRVCPRGHILRMATAGSAAPFPSSRFSGNILASTRQMKSTIFINKYEQGPPP
ncbi:Protein C9orf72 [Trichinella britovi]|uniref:Protein C9orf72 n=1 Tax=Trichinella britovi TaxID=45882 RepID=A0A0V1DI98_TRIBR|nr:Protein C9orf72 [Trichinella britovi]